MWVLLIAITAVRTGVGKSLAYLVPGIAFAAAYLSLFAVQRGPIPGLYGTTLILILALVALIGGSILKGSGVGALWGPAAFVIVIAPPAVGCVTVYV